MRRLLFVGFIPVAVFVTCLWALVRADSFSSHSHWARAIPSTPTTWLGAVLEISASAAVLAVLLQPFQVRGVRMLEGYWDRWKLTARLADVLVQHQCRRWQTIRRVADDEEKPRTEIDSTRPSPDQIHAPRTATERMRANARERFARLPPIEALLPTALGNALRAGEIRAGERYGLATLTSWPRIYPQMSRPLAAALDSARNTLDSSVNLCYSFFGCAVATGAAIYDQPELWWLPIGSLTASALAYKGAVTAAQTFAQLMHVVYDLHRFDLVKALHYQMPTREEEWDLFQHISDAFAGQLLNLPYEHEGSGSDQTNGASAVN